MAKSAHENELLQSQIGVSISLARSVVASWLPPLTEDEKKAAAATSASSMSSSAALFRNRRAPRAGLGAKVEKNEDDGLSIEEMKIKRRLVQKEKKVQQRAKEIATSGKSKKNRSVVDDNQESTDDETPRKGQKKLMRASSQSTNYDAHVTKKAKGSQPRGFGR